jgi:DNA-binding PadR family transcriptional regulator
MSGMQGEVLKGHLDLLLLATLAQGPAHGYGLVEALRGRSEGAFDLGEGTMYPALYRLERRGLVASRWEVVGGRRRRVYRLTRGGRGALERHRSDWRAFAQAVEAVVT